MTRSPGGWYGLLGIVCAITGFVAANVREYPYRPNGARYSEPHSELISIAYEVGGAAIGLTLFTLGMGEGHRAERVRKSPEIQYASDQRPAD